MAFGEEVEGGTFDGSSAEPDPDLELPAADAELAKRWYWYHIRGSSPS
jgi:hypothetical protein